MVSLASMGKGRQWSSVDSLLFSRFGTDVHGPERMKPNDLQVDICGFDVDI